MDILAVYNPFEAWEKGELPLPPYIHLAATYFNVEGGYAVMLYQEREGTLLCSIRIRGVRCYALLEERGLIIHAIRSGFVLGSIMRAAPK